jgi:hypothetical protein
MKLLVPLLLLLCAGSLQAAPYPLGTMTCDDIGNFASEAMGWRKGGLSREQALAKLEERDYGDPVEKKNLTVIVGLVYGGYGNNWSVEGAGRVMRGDCLRGREGEQ